MVGYNGQLIECEFIVACGPEEGPRAYVAFRCFLMLLALYGRRRLSFGVPGSIMLTLCEQQLLHLFAAAQEGMTLLVGAHLAWLMRRNHAEQAEAVIDCIAAALRARGHRLRLAPFQLVPPRSMRSDAVRSMR